VPFLSSTLPACSPRPRRPVGAWPSNGLHAPLTLQTWFANMRSHRTFLQLLVGDVPNGPLWYCINLSYTYIYIHTCIHTSNCNDSYFGGFERQNRGSTLASRCKHIVWASWNITSWSRDKWTESGISSPNIGDLPSLIQITAENEHRFEIMT